MQTLELPPMARIAPTSHNQSVKTIRVIIAEDHQILRAALRTLVEAGPEFTVVGEARNGADAAALALRTRPDVAVLDMRMPEMDGLAATRRITSEQPDLKVVIVTIDDSASAERKAHSAGASAIVTKDECVGKLLPTLRRVLSEGDAQREQQSLTG